MNEFIIHTTGGGLILMDEDHIMDNIEREDENISPHSTKPSEVATTTMKGEKCLNSHETRNQQHSLPSTDQCQVDLDPVVVMDKDLFHGDTRREEDAPPLMPSIMAATAEM